MKILYIKKLDGPNSWSDLHLQVIVMLVDVKKYKNLTTNNINTFSHKLQTMLPSLYDPKNNFLYKMIRGIPVEEVIGYVAKELQILAGMPSEYIKTDKISDVLYQVAFSYTKGNAGVYAGKAAVKIVETLTEGKEYSNIGSDINKLIQTANDSTQIPMREYNQETTYSL